MPWTPSTTQYADPATVKSPVWKAVTDAAPEPVLSQLVTDATTLVKDRTGRAWVQPASGQTLTYDAPLSNRLLTADFADVTGIVVKRNGADLVLNTDYVWLWRTIDGDYPHAYGVRLLSGLWADNANTAGRDVAGDITLTTAKPCTTPTPPGPIVQAVVRIVAAMYRQTSAAFGRGTTGTQETGRGPIPQEVITDDADVLLGPFIHPSRKIGRP